MRQPLRVVTRSPGSVSARLDGSLVILTPDQEYVEIDATGAEIWEALEATTDEAEIAAILAARHTVTVDRALSDVSRFIDQLQVLGAVQTASHSGGH